VRKQITAHDLARAGDDANRSFSQFQEKVKNYERWAKGNPGKFIQRVQRHIFFGWLGVLLFSIALVALLVWQVITFRGRGSGYVIAIVGGILFAILRVFLLRSDPIEERIFTKEELPTLWEQVEKIAKASGAPPLDGIVHGCRCGYASAMGIFRQVPLLPQSWRTAAGFTLER
jgi:hypothetical protein